MKNSCSIALRLFPIFGCSIYLYYLGLSRTSLSSTLILANTGSIFTFILGLLILREEFRIVKIFAIMFTLGGVVLIGLSDLDSVGEGEQLIGDAIILGSAFTLSLYSILLCYYIPPEKEESISMFMILAFVGFFILICGAPILGILHLTEWEKFRTPSPKILLFLTLNSIFGTILFDYFWSVSAILIGALVTNMGTALVIPLGMLVDNLWSGATFNLMYVGGSVSILCGFVGITII